MRTKTGFWDSSALVPLCVRQDTSPDFRKLWRQSSRVIVWWGATVEIKSALSRLRQDKFLDAQGLQLAFARLETMRRKWREIAPSDKGRDIAERLPDAHGLRALDSFQLAAALVWCNEKPKSRVFVCDDFKLSEAARNIGFTVVP